MKRLLLLVVLLVGGCDMPDIDAGGHRCTDEMAETREAWGSPEEVRTYDSAGYNKESWWYWSQGRERSFTWGYNVRGGCDVSTYTFAPR